MKRFSEILCWLLVSLTVLQPIAFAAKGGDREARETIERYAKEYKEGWNKTDPSERHHSTERHGGVEHEHFDYTDRNGARHELDMVREIEHISADDRRFSFKENSASRNLSVSFRDVPSPRQADLRDTATREGPKRQQEGFSSDQSKIHEFIGSMREARTERSEQDRASRAQLQSETQRLESAADSGAQISRGWLAKVEAAQKRVDDQHAEFTPPSLETIVNPGPEFQSQPAAPEAHQELKSNLAKQAESLALSSGMHPAEEAYAAAIDREIQEALQSGFERLSSFAAAHEEALATGAELAVDIALAGFPVANLTWGVVNLAKMAATGSTVMGRPAQGWADYAMVAVGAIVPTGAAKKLANLAKERPLIAKTLGRIRSTGTAVDDGAVKVFDQAAGLSNPIPKNGRFARVVPKDRVQGIKSGELSLARGAEGNEAFVTAADDLAELRDGKAIAEKLGMYADKEATTLKDLSDYSVLEFEIEGGVSASARSPVEFDGARDFGFVPGGKTSGGAREWLIDSNASTKKWLKNFVERPIR